MNRNLFLKELKRNRKNLWIWTAIVVGFTLMVLSIFPFMKEMGKDMAQLMDKMPPELSKAFGMDSQTWSNILGFYATYYGVYIVVLMSVFSASTGANIISKEEKDRTAEFLLTKPLDRRDVFYSKIQSLSVLMVVIYSIQSMFAVFGILMFGGDNVDWMAFWIMQFSGIFLLSFFTACGVLMSMYLTPKKNFMGLVVGLTFGTYFLNAIAKSTSETEFLGYASPFHYFDFTIFDPNYSFNFLGAAIFLILSVLIILISFRTYLKKDIAG